LPICSPACKPTASRRSLPSRLRVMD
jgi:hypothetical protein